MELKVKLNSDLAKMPVYQTSGSSGMDVASIDLVVLEPGEIKMVSTGLSFEIPVGYEIQVRPRSGLAAKHGITVLNSPGTIDQDYTGLLKIILVNFGMVPFKIYPGDRIAQIVLAPVRQASLVEVQELHQTERADKGFGSTGIQ